MLVRLDNNGNRASNWATAYLRSLLGPCRSARRVARVVGPATRLGVTALEDRVTPATLHWLGSPAGNGNLWGVATNWLEGRAPASGDRLVFDASSPGFSATANGFAPTNDVAGLTDLSIGINDASPAGDFAIGGKAVTLATAAGVAVTSTVSSGTAAAFNNPVTLAAATTVSVGLGTLNLGGVVGGGFSLTAANAPSSTLTLVAANTYTGGTVLASGVVAVSTNTSLGTGAITFGGGTLSNAGSFLKLPNPFAVSAPSNIGGGGFLDLDGNGVLNSTLTLSNTGFLALNGALSGPGGLREVGFPGGTTLGGTAANSFTGGTTVVFGGLTLKKPAGVRALASAVKVTGSYASLTLGASNQLIGTAVALGKGASFQTNDFSDTVSSLTGLGDLSTGFAAASGITVTGGGSQLLSGGLSGSGTLAYSGVGTLTLAGPSASFSGILGANNGSLLVAADFSGATALVTGGSLGGTGVVKSITTVGGSVDAATRGTGGMLNTAAGKFASTLVGSNFRADLAARGPSDQLALGAGATIDLTGANLAATGVGATLADSYPLITSATGGITGTFLGLPNASTFAVGSQTFRITYTPTAVSLTNLGASTRSRHWIGAVGSNWSTPGNWNENSAPVSGDTLVYDTSTARFAATAAAFAPNNDLNGLTNISVVINDSSTAGDFVIGGALFGLTTTAGVGVSSTVVAGAGATINNPLFLGANTSVNAGLGVLTLGGPVGGKFALTAAGSPAGTLNLALANTYGGGTVLKSGTVAVGDNDSLGGGTLTFSGGTLASTTSFLTVTNPFVVSAPSTIGGGGFFDLNGNGVLNADLRLTNTGFLVLRGALSGAGGLIEDGFPGGTTLSGTTANSYTGQTTIISGSLTLQKLNGVNAVSPLVTLEGGSFPRLSLGASNQMNGLTALVLGADSSFSTGGYSDSVASLSGNGDLDTSFSFSGAAGLTVSGPGASLYTGTVRGSGVIRTTGTGSLTLGGGTTFYSGQLIAAGGSLLVASDFSGATAVALPGGTLGGTGLVKNLPTRGNGTLNPGGTGTGGILTTAPGSTLVSAPAGQTLLVDLSDLALSDQLVIGDLATVNLTGTKLSVNLLHSTFGTVFPIVTSASGGISGVFNGLPDNSTLTAAGRLFRVRYTPFAATLTDLQSVTLTPTTLPQGEARVPYSQSITSTGGTAPVTLAVTGVTNATGLTIAGDGTGTVTLSGTPTAAGTVTFTVTPTDAGGGPQAGTTYAVVINPPVVLTPATLPASEVGLAYAQTITPAGGTGTITLALSAVTNATGLTIAGDGTGTITVSGTPTVAGPVTFTVTPSDAFGPGTPVVYTFTVNPALGLSPAALPAGEVKLPYRQTVAPSGGAAPTRLVVSKLVNPTGLAVTGSGTGVVTVSGTPTAAGSVSFTVTATDSLGVTATADYAFAVSPPVNLTPAALPAGEVGIAYTQTVTASGGTGPVSLSISGVTNATGLTISGVGTNAITVSGTPTAAGPVVFTVTATDNIGAGPGTVYSFAVRPPVALSPAVLPGGRVGLAYAQAVTPVGGVTPTTLLLSEVTNATGLTLSGSGTGTITLGGTPTATGVVSFTVTATDALGGQAKTTYSFSVSPAIVVSPAALAVGEVGLGYGQSITTTGGSSAVTLSLSGVTNATGLTISGSGTGTVTISGTPTVAGTVSFTLTPSDSVGAAPPVTYSFSVSGPVALTPATLPAGEAGLAYGQSITSVGGAAPVTLTLSAVTNATGLTIAGGGTGTISLLGTPTAAGTVTFTVTASDALGGVASAVYTFVVNPAVVLTPAALPTAKIGSAYSQSITSMGGTAPVFLTVSGVSNSSGLTVAGTGTGTVTVTGTPGGFGTLTFTVTPTSAAGTGAGRVYTVVVPPPPPLLVGVAQFAVGSDAAGPPGVTLYKADPSLYRSFEPFPGYTGGVRTAAADFNGDGVPDVVAGTGPGGPARVRVLDGTDGHELFAIDPFEASFTGGVFVAAGDLNADGLPDLVITPDQGGGPRVRVFDGATFTQLADFFGIDDPAFRGGARANVGDVTGDGVGDLLVAAGFGGGPRVAVFDGRSLVAGKFTSKPFGDFFAFEDTLRNGVYVAAGDFDGDGKAELVVGAGPGGGPRVSAFSGAGMMRGEATRVVDFFAGDTNSRGGARVAVKNLDGDNLGDLVVGAGAGAGSRVTGYAGKTLVGNPTPDPLLSFLSSSGFDGGVYVG